MNRNCGFQIIFIGQNGEYTSNDDLIWQHRMMIEHSTAKYAIAPGLSSDLPLFFGSPFIWQTVAFRLTNLFGQINVY